VWNAVSPALLMLLDWFIATGWPLIRDIVDSVWNSVIKPVIDGLTNIWNAVSPALSSLFGWFINDGLPAIQSALEWFWHNVIEPLINVLSTIWDVLQAPFDLLKGGVEGVFSFLTDIVDGFIGAIRSIGDAVNDAKEWVDNLNQTGKGRGGLFGSGIGPDFDPIGGIRDSGGPGVAGMPYLIGQGAQPELFVPQTNGQFIPNADQLLAGAGGEQFTFGDLYIQMPAEALRDPATAQRRGGEFAQAFMEKVRERGG
jgi:hypothetical protein